MWAMASQISRRCMSGRFGQLAKPANMWGGTRLALRRSSGGRARLAECCSPVRALSTVPSPPDAALNSWKAGTAALAARKFDEAEMCFRR